MKAYVVFARDSIDGEDYCVGVFLDKDKCIKYVEKSNSLHNEEQEKIDMCRQCKEDGFLLPCEEAAIGNDRYGVYCENDISGPHCATADWYYYEEKDVIDE